MKIKLTKPQQRLLQEGYADLTADPNRVAFEGTATFEEYQGYQLGTIHKLKKLGLIVGFCCTGDGLFWEITWNIEAVFWAAQMYQMKTFAEVEQCTQQW